MKSLAFVVALVVAGYLGLHFTPAGRRSLTRMQQSEQRQAATASAPKSAPAAAAVAAANETEHFIESWESPMLLVFWQPHCGACEQMEPMVSEIQRRNPVYRVVRINTQSAEYRAIVDRYSLRGTPTFIVTLRGRELRRKEGGYATLGEFVAFAQPSKVY